LPRPQPKPARRFQPRKPNRNFSPHTRAGSLNVAVSGVALGVGAVLVIGVILFHQHYTINLQSPIVLQFRSPVVIARRDITDGSKKAQLDQEGKPLTAYQQYACAKFGADCRIALAIQRAENPLGKCETYHYNSDGTLDWGYFQINTVHLKRPGLNLRDLLDCKANIDFAFQLFQESRGFSAWSTYKNGAYRRFLTEP
jgi:hypothetical protein